MITPLFNSTKQLEPHKIDVITLKNSQFSHSDKPAISTTQTTKLDVEHLLRSNTEIFNKKQYDA